MTVVPDDIDEGHEMKHRFVALLFVALLALVPACAEVGGEGEGEGGGEGQEQEEGGGGEEEGEDG